MGEGSVSYLFFTRSIETILRFNPEAKFIAMVRNPLDMVYSYYQRLLYVAEEDQQDFATAWALQEARAQGSNLPKRCRQPALLQYEQVGRMGHHIENLFRLAPKAKCHVIVFDDFKADTEGVYRKVLEFIGVDYKKRPHFQIKRESRQYKSRLLQTLIYNPPFQTELLMKIWLYSTRTYKRRRDGKKRFGLKKLRQRLRKWNTSHDPVIPLSEDLRSTLGETFESDIQKLGSLLGRDFSHWK
jgi:hypothetical protein